MSEATFAFSTTGGGNGNGRGHGGGNVGQPQLNPIPEHPARSSTFAVSIKPKDPPIFHGRASEDVDTWLYKLMDFFYLTEVND